MNNILSSISSSLMNIGNSVILSLLNGVYSVAIILIFLFLGYIVASIIKWCFVKIFEYFKVREKFEENEFTSVLNKWHFDRILLILLELTIVLTFVQQATLYVNAVAFSYYLQQIILYIPSLIIGLILLIGSLILSEYVKILLSWSDDIFTNAATIVLQIIIVYIGIIYSLKYIIPNFNGNVLVMILQYILITFTLAFGFGFAIAIGLGLKDSINQAARKNQGIFDNILAKIGGSLNKSIKSKISKKTQTRKKSSKDNNDETEE